MNKIFWGLLLVAIGAVACHRKKFMIRSLPLRQGLSLNWYHYSDITNFSPDYVEIADRKENRTEVIFEASSICQIQVRSDSILILMVGNTILQRADDNDYHFKIIVDTTCRGAYLYK